MTADATQRWLAELQSRFSAVLRTPLSAAGGTLHSDLASYPDLAVADVLPGPQLTASDRLGVYQRQYWMRLLNLLQEQFPLTVHLCGAWGFNQHAIAFLTVQPPRGCDLGDVVEGFDGFLATELRGDPVRHSGVPPVPRRALIDAAHLDASYRRVFMAAEQPAFRLTAAAAAELVTRRLRVSCALAVVAESWPLLELRARIAGRRDVGPPVLPNALAQRRSWALHRTERGIAHVALDAEQARLLELLPQHALGAALAVLESECEPAQREGLPERTRVFLARAVQLGFFSGLADA